MRQKFIDEITRIKTHNPKAVNASWFRTHYLNEWVTDDDLLIINLDNARLETFDPDDYPGCVYGLGVDLGFVDATSFTVKAWSVKTGFSHFVESTKEVGMDITDVADKVKMDLKKRFRFSYYQIDGANKQGVEEIKNRHKIPFESAEKQGKPTYLRLLKDDVKIGRAGIDEEGCHDLLSEWQSLIWKDKTRKEEHEACENHCSDSALYIWRKARNYLWKPEQKEPDRNSEEYLRKQKQDLMDRMERIKQARDHDEKKYMY